MNSGLANRRSLGAMQINPYVAMLPAHLQSRATDFFIISTETAITASGVANAQASIDNESDFMILAATRTVVVTGTEGTNIAFPPLLVNVGFGSGIYMQDRSTHIENLFGTAQLPSVWPVPRFVPRNTTITVALENKAAVAYTVRLSFHGFRIRGFENRS